MSTIIFGDSFVGSFKLVDDTNLVVWKFKGGTMKGLTKNNNENKEKIIRVLTHYRNVKCIVFGFGQVDLNFSYYYSKYVKKEVFDAEHIIKEYVEFISNLKCNTDCKKIILAVYPSTIQDKHYFDCLMVYKVLPPELVQSISDDEKKKVSNFEFRYDMYKKFNNLIKKYCKIYKIIFVSLDNILLNKNRTLKKKFYNPMNIYNIHLSWEPLIPILLTKIKCCNIKKKYNVDLKKSFTQYISDNKRDIDVKIKEKNDKIIS